MTTSVHDRSGAGGGRTVGEAALSGTRCVNCGIPQDAEYFDDADVQGTPARGRVALLASFQLPSRYCGVLRFFSQFTDRHAANPAEVETRGLRWLLLVNGRPLHPYTDLQLIVNPWGYGSFRICIRLDENARVELAVRNVNHDLQQPDAITRVGGRIVGQYWYNTRYGDVVRFTP